MSQFCAERKLLLALPFLFLFLAGEMMASGEELPPGAHATAHVIPTVTNVSQFAALSNNDYIVGCNFHLTGVVTLVDANRSLVVLQDGTGAVAVNFRPITSLQVGQSVTMDGTNAVPLFSNFPDFPFHPAGREVLGKFETISNWGEYNLTRLRGYLRPPVTGNYRFWIASDNSSELWLSTDANAWNARRIAVIPRFGWTEPRQWTGYTSQHSDLIPLKAGETYYIEALQEQTAEAENLSVAWQEPGSATSPISIIDEQYLKPWHVQNAGFGARTNGILWEYWTNYPAGDVAGMAGTRHFESALSVESVAVHINGSGELPKPESLVLNRPWRAEDSYRWVSAEGLLKFTASDGDVAQMEFFTGRSLIHVRAPHRNDDVLKKAQQLTNAFVRVEGVCEGIHDSTGAIVPGLIWASADQSVSVLYEATNELPNIESDLTPASGSSSQALQEYFQTQGVITFNDRVFNKNLIFIQGENSLTEVIVNKETLKQQLIVGRCIELGGKLGIGKYIQSITPFFAADLGQQTMPAPLACPPAGSAQPNLEGRWSEIEGVVHSVNTNGTLVVVGKNGLAYIWIGKTESNYLTQCVDAKLRARGVLSMAMLDAPLVLVPSRSFVDIEEKAPDRPFEIPRQSVADVLSEAPAPFRSHRVRIVGAVTYRDGSSFFIQDTTGGIRVQTIQDPGVKVGDRLEIAAFPSGAESTRDLTEPLVHPVALKEDITAGKFDLNDASSARQSGTLVEVSATVLVRKINGANQILDMQEKQRIFTATLLTDHGSLPEIVPGSRVRVTGIRQDPSAATLISTEQSMKVQLPASVNILLRSPEDIQVLSEPPWWTWQESGILGGLLLIMLTVALLWTHLLRRRLERQQAEQLAFSRQVLSKLEEERSRIAGNLHDSLGQTLMVIKHRVISAADSLSAEPSVQSSMHDISAVASQAIDEVRRITHGLGPHQLDHLGLTRAIRAVVDRASENSSVIFASRIENIDGILERDAEIHVYRIVQEAVTNILKHSAATEATVVVKKQSSAVSISIRDNGRGFDTTKPTNQLHDFGYGLSGIAERVRILKGTLTVESQPGAGTNLAAEIPFMVPKRS